jgi:hypothetical protein
MRPRFLAVSLAAVMSVQVLQAKQVGGGPDPDRNASTAVVSSDRIGALAAVSISYTPPKWRDEYDAALEQLEGNYMRLGKGWWTTFDTIGTLEIGGTKIEAGSYYLGLVGGKDGAFSLLLFDSKQAMKARLLPGTTALYTGEAKAEIKTPLTLAKNSLKEVVVAMEIEIAADKQDPATGKFSIRWGKHELSAPVRFHLAGPKDATVPKK